MIQFNSHKVKHKVTRKSLLIFHTVYLHN